MRRVTSVAGVLSAGTVADRATVGVAPACGRG